MSRTSFHEASGLLSGLGIQCCPELWCSLKKQLGSCVAVAMVQAGCYSSNSTPSLGTFTCCRCGPKKKKKKKDFLNCSMRTTHILNMDGHIAGFPQSVCTVLTLSSTLLPTERNFCSINCLKALRTPHSEEKEKNENQLISYPVKHLEVHYVLCVLRIYPQIILPGGKLCLWESWFCCAWKLLLEILLLRSQIIWSNI